MLKLLSPGLLTTVQDLGRRGLQADGIPEAGAIDAAALRIGNRLTGNHESAAGLEITLLGPALEAQAPMVVALTGADLAPQRNGCPAPMWEAFALEPGDRLTFAGLQSGCRCYLAVAGGIDVPPVLGSRSSDLLGKVGLPPLKGGALLPVSGEALPPADLVGRRLPQELRPVYPAELTVRVVPGPQDDHFRPDAYPIMAGSAYLVSPRSDRMGVRLEGPILPHAAGADIISDGMPLGGIQVPPDGKPIVLLRGRQTMGGYAKIGVVISPDVDRIGQVPPGGRLRFEWVTRDQAHLLHRIAADDLQMRLDWCMRPPERPSM